MSVQVIFQVSVVEAGFGVVTLLAFILLNRYWVRRNLPYPPGPRPLPILGSRQLIIGLLV